MQNKTSEDEITVIWQRIYKEWFGLEKDFSSLQIPDNYDPDKHFGVVVAEELDTQSLIIAMEKKFSVRCRVVLFLEKYSATDHDRTAVQGDYFVFFKKTIEADEEFKNLSAKYLWKQKHQGITLIERLLMEVFYFETTQSHLDTNTRTLCCGSRDIDRSVPCVYYSLQHDCLMIDWEYKSFSSENSRSREFIVA